jgi:glutamate carboxypeptidase
MDLKARAYEEETAWLTTLEGLVRLESPTQVKSACDRLADHLAARLENDGWVVIRTPRDEVGDILTARWGHRTGSTDGGTLLLCHYDTVWPIGTLERMPFRREANQVFGPGTCDMKAGIATALHAKRLAEERVESDGATLRGPVTLLLTSDEEAGSLQSRDLIETEAKRHDRVLVLEPSRDDGALKVGRKGVGEFRAEFTGRSAHAGNNPRDGASALRELAHFLFFAENLTDFDRRTTVNVTVAAGGTVSNVIAEEAHARVDIRVLTMAEGERVETAIGGYAPEDDRVTVVVHGGLNRPPLERTPANEALMREANERMRELGMSLETAVVGGGSDGNFTSALGVATLDGLGSSGSGPHARHEHIRVRGSPDRLALVTALLLEGGVA